MTYRILVSGADAVSELVSRELDQAGYQVERATNLDDSMSAIDSERVDAVVACLEGNGSDLGVTLVREISERQHEPVIAVGEADALPAAQRAGAFELVSLPASAQNLSASIARVLARRSLERSISEVRRHMRQTTLVGESEAMEKVRRVIAQVCGSDVDVLVGGEQGSGKKLIAQHIHAASRRSEGPLVFIDLSAIPPEEHEPRLFGERDNPGALTQADGGTLVIEEPAALRLELQTALMEALRERTLVTRQGAIALDVRVIATTHRRLEHLVALGEFDQELYTRLATVVLIAPPLRERGYDVLQLADHFAHMTSQTTGRPAPHISAAASRELLAYNWPGNVRELKEAIEEASASQRGAIEVSDLPERVLHSRQTLPAAAPPKGMPTLDDVERRYIGEVLAAVDGNKSRASRVLGVDRRTLYRKLRKLGYDAEESGSSPLK